MVRQKCSKYLSLTIMFAVITLRVFMLETYISLNNSIEVGILSALVTGIIIFFLYKFLMKYV